MVNVPRSTPMYADKGYDSAFVKQEFRNFGYIDRVSVRRLRQHRVVNSRRTIVENVFSWIDKNRRLILRYDSLIQTYESFSFLAFCKIILNPG